MDEQTVRQRVDAHAQAIVAGDLRRAGEDLAPEAMSAAGEVMRQLPRPVASADVTALEPSGDEMVARIVYSGQARSVTVESRWADRAGAPKMVDLEVV